MGCQANCKAFLLSLADYNVWQNVRAEVKGVKKERSLYTFCYNIFVFCWNQLKNSEDYLPSSNFWLAYGLVSFKYLSYLLWSHILPGCPSCAVPKKNYLSLDLPRYQISIILGRFSYFFKLNRTYWLSIGKNARML